MPLNADKPKRKTKEKKILVLENCLSEINTPVEAIDPDELIFALDIGTRTVVGVAGVQDKDNFRIVAAEVVEHKNRAMMDGQIHDILQVAEVAKEVKSRLESKIGVQLTKVAIAAAGRVLKTCEVKIERDIDQGREIDHETVSSLEIEGIQLAQMKLDEEMPKDDKTQFYCVGYSVINYYLNNYIISTLVGHKGKKIGAEILATFLPHIVVDSLYTVMSKIGLEVVSLTLEPIAAINVTIPKDLRLLNLALVDIGAGTSDIAITRDGSVVAYAMAPLAGDEITEKIAQHYLVDFNTSEKIKLALSSKKESVSFVDILGKKQSVKLTEVLEVIKPSVELLAETIAQKIVEYNHKAPNAVFLIGGGSQIPGLTDMVSKYLKLPNERVVVRGRDIIQNVKFSGKMLKGPESITPIGIAITAQMQKGQDFMSVTVNGKKVRLFNSKKLTVADALILIGFDPSSLIGRTGKSIMFELNGVKKTVKGGYGKAAEIFVNGVQTSVDARLSANDEIRIIPSENGNNAEARISDFIKKTERVAITLNGNEIDIGARYFINGKAALADSEIKNDDVVHISEITTLADIEKLYEIDIDGFEFFVNGGKEEKTYIINPGDVIEYKRMAKYEKEKSQPLGNDAIEKPEPDDGASRPQTPGGLQDFAASAADSGFHVVVNGKNVTLDANKSHYIFVDIFNFIDFDLTRPQGSIVLKLNGNQAAFTDEVRPGDTIDIYWAK